MLPGRERIGNAVGRRLRRSGAAYLSRIRLRPVTRRSDWTILLALAVAVAKRRAHARVPLRHSITVGALRLHKLRRRDDLENPDFAAIADVSGDAEGWAFDTLAASERHELKSNE